MVNNPFDVIIIGAGPAGLSAALFLARYRRNVLTIHHNSPRNIYSHGVHGFLGHHGIAPAELLVRGREEVLAHGGQIMKACATKIEKVSEDTFQVEVDNDSARTLITRRILLATGLRDLTPTCEGFREFYGSSVFHCPDCDGFEISGKRVGVLGFDENIVGFTLELLTWTEKLTLLTDGHATELDKAKLAKLASFQIEIRNDKVIALEGDSETKQLRRVVFNEGEPLECDALFFNLGIEPASRLHEMLGCKLVDEFVWVDKTQETSVAGVYAAGDITPFSQLAVVAAAEGAMAAIHIHQSLIPHSRRV
ncbi:MAG TPA: NAD(P)/FAD-dependent oxidoreductase [Pyrinomonadaceae bacterium]|nr:NAD(P)/FAD-dependent oxidoreductase [Pyrinomonadaceae bacterium]